jgi:hypothetical protein
MNAIHQLKLNIDNNVDCEDLIKECIIKYSDSQQNKRGLMTLIIRYNILKDNFEELKELLYKDDLMQRDYLTFIDYFLSKDDSNNSLYVQYAYSKIDELLPKDIDLMISKNWVDLIKKFDGFTVVSTLESNIDINQDLDTQSVALKKYTFDVSVMRDKYINRIKNKEELDLQLKDVDILIDGANMGHIRTKGNNFDFTILKQLIHKFENMNKRPKIILHQRHIIKDKFLEKYIIRTPMYRNDDDYMIYGMLVNNIMVLSNDMFRDHLKNMDGYTKCYVSSMTMKYVKNEIIIPEYSYCIQVINDNIYIPCKNGFYKL